MKKTVVLRHEVKSNERRSPLTPAGAKILLEEGIEVLIESSPTRIFKDSEYEAVGCKIVEMGYWRMCSSENLILGLKELPEEDFPLEHSHIYFAHIFKQQDGFEQAYKRYEDGGGELFDLEFLTDENNRRVSAFGYWAGYVGAAAALFEYYQEEGLTHLVDFENKDLMIEEIKRIAQEKPIPKTIIIGALGRCGAGAKDLLSDCGLTATNWDMEETKAGGPFQEILEHDIFINAALIFKKINPFITRELLEENDSKLKVISDVSCDPTSDLNTIPLYDKITSWEEPTVSVEGSSLKIIAVDNLPSVLPRESSEDFAEQLFPHLLEYIKKEELPLPFQNAKNAFNKNKPS